MNVALPQEKKKKMSIEYLLGTACVVVVKALRS